jgi:hypothetical protein
MRERVSTHHLLWHCFGVCVTPIALPIAFDTKTQNPTADTSDLPARANSSIVWMSQLCSSDVQVPFEHVQCGMTNKERSQGGHPPFHFVSLYCIC